jgi:hypothetical protein
MLSSVRAGGCAAEVTKRFFAYGRGGKACCDSRPEVTFIGVHPNLQKLQSEQVELVLVGCNAQCEEGCLCIRAILPASPLASILLRPVRLYLPVTSS